jgi:hypothetical protein
MFGIGISDIQRYENAEGDAAIREKGRCEDAFIFKIGIKGGKT